MAGEKIILVEGNDDVHAIIHVLKKRGAFVDGEVEFFDSRGWDQLLASVPVRLKSSSHTVVGIVADADNAIASRWAELKTAIEDSGFIGLPSTVPRGGFTASSARGLRVGVWLMPNNQDNGALEEFLLTLVNGADTVLSKARSVVLALGEPEKRFVGVATTKAIVHTYLAWQESPADP